MYTNKKSVIDAISFETYTKQRWMEGRYFGEEQLIGGVCGEDMHIPP